MPSPKERGSFVRIRDRLTYANVMATIAVFGVLAGGGAYAASKIGTNDIARHAVTRPKLAKGSVNTAKVRNHSLRANDLVAGASGDIVVRVRGDEHVQTTHQGVPYPVTGGTWTQPGDALNVIYGRVTVDIPNNCVGPSTPGNGVGVSFSVNGEFIGGVDARGGLNSFGPFLVWEPGQDVQRTLTVRAVDACEPGSGAHGTVTSAQVDVIEFR
jgi:hypothetical protein